MYTSRQSIQFSHHFSLTHQKKYSLLQKKYIKSRVGYKNNFVFRFFFLFMTEEKDNLDCKENIKFRLGKELFHTLIYMSVNSTKKLQNWLKQNRVQEKLLFRCQFNYGWCDHQLPLLLVSHWQPTWDFVRENLQL